MLDVTCNDPLAKWNVQDISASLCKCITMSVHLNYVWPDLLLFTLIICTPMYSCLATFLWRTRSHLRTFRSLWETGPRLHLTQSQKITACAAVLSSLDTSPCYFSLISREDNIKTLALRVKIAENVQSAKSLAKEFEYMFPHMRRYLEL